MADLDRVGVLLNIDGVGVLLLIGTVGLLLPIGGVGVLRDGTGGGADGDPPALVMGEPARRIMPFADDAEGQNRVVAFVKGLHQAGSTGPTCGSISGGPQVMLRTVANSRPNIFALLGVITLQIMQTVVIDDLGEGHAVLTVRTDGGDLILDNKVDAVLPWHEVTYEFIKRESSRSAEWIFLEREERTDMIAMAR